MQLEIAHPDFKSQRLAVETATWFSGPKLLVNGSRAEKHKGRYLVRSDTGEEISVELKYNLLDPIPRVKVRDEPFELAPPLQWYEYAWIGVPILLIFIGGAIGGFVGALGSYANGRIFRGSQSSPAKYGLSALVTVGAVITYVVLATLFHIAIGGRQQ